MSLVVINSLLFLLCCSSSLVSCDGVPDLKIGVILNTNLRAGREEKIAIELAAKLFKTSNSKLSLSFRESTDGNPLQAYSHADNLINVWGADAVITTGTWREVAPVAEAGHAAKVPVLSLASTPAPPSSAFQHALLQLSYPSSTTVNYLVDLIGSFNWRRTILLYEDDDYGSIGGTLVANLTISLQNRRVGVAGAVPFPALDSVPSPEALVRKELLRLNSNSLCKVFVVLRSSPWFTMVLFKQAHALGMMAGGYAWVLADDGFASHIDSAQYGSTFISSYMRGVIGTKIYFNKTTPSYRRFRAEFRRSFQLGYSKAGEKHYDPGIYALRACDAVRALARASYRSGHTTLLQGVLSSSFEGLSGYVSFGGDGSLAIREGRMALQVINYVGKSYEEVGFWSEGSGLYEQKDIDHPGIKVGVLGPMNWPGRPRKSPGGWGRLKVGVPNAVFHQFAKVEGYDYQNKEWKVTGYCIDIFRETANSLNYSLDYEFIPFSGTYDELVDQVAFQKFDAAVGDITILAERSKKVDFTEPFLSSSLSMVVPARPKGRAWLFLRPFSKEVLAMITGFYIFTAIVLWYLETNTNPDPGPWTAQLGNTLWLMCSTIFFPLVKIHSTFSKIIVVVWLFVVMIIVQTYTASLSAILVAEKLEPVIDDSSIGCDAGSFLPHYLHNVLHIPKDRIVMIQKQEDYQNKFEKGNITAAYLETPSLKVFLSNQEGYTVYGQTHRLAGYGFVFPKGSELVSDFNMAILQLTENGTVDSLESQQFSFNISGCGVEKFRQTEGLTLDNLWGLFIITGGTTSILFLLSVIQRHGLEFCLRVPHAFRALREWLKKLYESMCALWKNMRKVLSRLTVQNAVHSLEEGRAAESRWGSPMAISLHLQTHPSSQQN